MDEKGNDYTKEFIYGAKRVKNLSKKYKIEKAILKSGSPSCGVRLIYNGRFNGQKKEGSGVLAATLKRNGLEVEEID